MERSDDTSKTAVLRIIDANANRCAEGIRVIEEIARFSRADGELSRRLKEIRHETRRLASRSEERRVGKEC